MGYLTISYQKRKKIELSLELLKLFKEAGADFNPRVSHLNLEKYDIKDGNIASAAFMNLCTFPDEGQPIAAELYEHYFSVFNDSNIKFDKSDYTIFALHDGRPGIIAQQDCIKAYEAVLDSYTPDLSVKEQATVSYKKQ